MFTTKEWSVSCNNETVTSTSQVAVLSIEDSELSDNDQLQFIKRKEGSEKYVNIQPCSA